MTTQAGSMKLPASFVTWAPLKGRVVKIAVVMAKGEIEDVARDDTQLWYTAEDDEPMRAWAVKALAWLKAEWQRTPHDLYLRGLEDVERSIRESLTWFSEDRLPPTTPTNTARAAREILSALPKGIGEAVRAAHMEDLVDRCAEEMRRQAEEVARASR